MLIRITRGRPRPGQEEELARRWQAFAPERLRQMPGFRHAWAAVDREGGAGVLVTVWDRRPDAAEVERLNREFRPQIEELLSGEPTVEEYEVLAEV